MHVFEWLLAALAGWTVVGTLGTLLARSQRDHARVRRGLAAMAGTWALYLVALVSVGHWQRQRTIAPGQPECFGDICFTVTGVRSTAEFKGRGNGSLVEVSVVVANRGSRPAATDGVRAYLVDVRGRRWAQTRGLGGVALGVELAPGQSTVSTPVFRVEPWSDHPQLALVLTRGWKGWGWLTIGDTDSMGHKPTLLRLP